MMNDYSSLFIKDAMDNLASCFDYAVNFLGFDIDEFTSFFLSSGYDSYFYNLYPQYVSGIGGSDAADRILEKCNLDFFPRQYITPSSRSKEYWAGWALAYFQWHHNISFEEIFSHTTITDIVNMYHPYHEMDLEHFVDRMAKICELDSKPTKLKTIRKQKGFTQEKLAIFAEMPLRTLQQYEQRQKSINKASAETVYLLAKALDVKVEDILE